MSLIPAGQCYLPKCLSPRLAFSLLKRWARVAVTLVARPSSSIWAVVAYQLRVLGSHVQSCVLKFNRSRQPCESPTFLIRTGTVGPQSGQFCWVLGFFRLSNIFKELVVENPFLPKMWSSAVSCTGLWLQHPQLPIASAASLDLFPSLFKSFLPEHFQCGSLCNPPSVVLFA